MLFIDDDQSQIFIFHRFLQQLVGADHDVDFAIGQIVQNCFLFFRCIKAGQAGNLHRPVSKAVGEVLIVLLSQQSCRHQDGDLFAAVGDYESGAHGNFSFAKTDITADDSIHRLRAAQIVQHIGDCSFLIRCFFKRKAVAEAGVLVIVDVVGAALNRCAAGVNIEQFGGDIARLFGGFFTRFRPLV